MRTTGAVGSENAGMSNRKVGEKPTPRKSKVSSATEIGGGLGGPKAMAKAVADGQLVNIPAPSYSLSDGVTECSRSCILMVWCLLSRVRR